MHKFPSIEQFRHVIRAVRDTAEWRGIDVPTLEFRGTVKLHGTNASISNVVGSDVINFHSRSRTLSDGDDNMGFRTAFVNDEAKMEALLDWFKMTAVDADVECGKTITVFGEWCGRGIQKGVAISEIDPQFIAFAVAIQGETAEDANHDTNRWIDPDTTIPSRAFRWIEEFSPPFWINIDFNQPELAQNLLVQMTTEVEECCPVGKSFGIEGVGEGIVWQPWHADWRSSRYWFKVKGEKHSVSKVSTLANVDPEVIKAKTDLVNALVTEARLEQGWNELIQQCGPIVEMKQIGDYLRWVFNDVIKEESDTIEASGFQQKDLGKPISDVAKRYFMKRFNDGS